MDNKISHHDINEETQFKVDKERHEQKKRKFRPKTKVQRLKSVFYILTGVWLFCQGVSALLAATGFYYLASIYINANAFAVGSFVFLASLGLELAFNALNNTIAKQKYDDKTAISKVLKGMLVFFGLIYAGSTFIGTPYAVQFLAASPDYNDIDKLGLLHKSTMAKDSTYYNDQLFMAQSSADAFLLSHGKRDCKDIERCPWRIRTGDLAQHNTLLAKVDSVSSLASISRLAIKAESKAELVVAMSENKAMKADHFAWCSSFGWGLSFVSIFCIFIFLPSFHWCQWHEREEVIDNESMLSKMEEAKDKEKAQERFEIEKLKALSAKVTDRDEDKETPKVIEDEPSTPIGFAFASHKEGDILIGEGRKSDRVYVEVKGELRAMTPGELNTLIKGQSTPERINHLEGLKNKLK